MKALLALALVGCAHVPVAPGALEAGGLARLYCVDQACTVLRSAQPSAAEFSELVARYGLRSVVKLNTWLPGDGGEDALPGGVEMYAHPWAPAGPVDHDDVQAAIDAIDQAPKPVLVHCAHGQDRTGVAIALWRIRHGTPIAEAVADMLAHGFHRNLAGLAWSFERETGVEP